MTTKYNCNFERTFPFANDGMLTTLVASTALPYVVPGTDKQIYRTTFSVSPTVDVWVRLNGTAIVPVSGVATATYNQERINPFDPHRYVRGGDTLSFISTGTPQVGVSLLLVQEVRV